MELFKIHLSFIERQVHSTQAIIGQLGQIRENEAELAHRKEDVNLQQERENILLNTRLSIMDRIRQVADLDSRAAEIAIQREIAAEERRVQIAKDKQEEAARSKKATEESLPGLEKNLAAEKETAGRTKLEQGTAAAISGELYKKYDEMRRALEKIEQGRISGIVGYGKSAGSLANAGESLTAEDAALAVALRQSPFAINDAAKTAAQMRLQGVRAKMSQLSGQVLGSDETMARTDAQAAQAAARLEEAKKRIATEETNIQQGKLEEQTEDAKLRQLKEDAEAIQRGQQDTIRTRSQRELLESLPAANLPGNAGGAANEVRDLLREIRDALV
jgi:hypothetical protein